MICPPALEKGDLIHVVAPSGPFESNLLQTGLAKLSLFRTRLPATLLSRRDGFLAGTDNERLTELQAAFDCLEARAILVARGGYGLGRLLERLDLSGLKKNPKWLVGFSDVTLLHAQVASEGFLSIHGANGTTLALTSDEEVSALVRLLTGDLHQSFVVPDVLTEGKANGPLFGGNLTTLFAEAAAHRLKIPPGAILFLEDVTETSYRIDRMLNSLRVGGYFKGLRAIVLGEFLDCSPGKFGVPTSKVLADNLGVLGIPLVAGLPFGHGAQNFPLLHGGHATLDTHTRTLTINASP